MNLQLPKGVFRVVINRVQPNTRNKENKGVLAYIDYTRYVKVSEGVEIADSFKGNTIIAYQDKNTNETKYFIDYHNTKYQDKSGEWKKNYDRFSSLSDGNDTDKGEFEREVVMGLLRQHPDAASIFGAQQPTFHTQDITPESFNFNTPQQTGFDNLEEPQEPSQDIDLNNITF